LRIKEFLISRYGPLAFSKRVKLDSFNLFFGMNEQGKTLTIDALVKMLLGRGVKNFEDIERVEEKPEGYVILEKKEEPPVKLPQKSLLSKIAGITASECRNIFIIRNSDLSIQEQGEFFTIITDKLTGLRVEEIKKIKDALLKIACVTPTWIFRDTREDRLKSRIDEAGKLISKIEDMLEQMKSEEYDLLFERIVLNREEMNVKEKRIKELELARSREKYEQGRKVLEELRKAQQEIFMLEKYTEQELKVWEDAEKEINRLLKERENLSRIIEENKKKRESFVLKKEKKQEDFDLLTAHKAVIESEIKPRVREIEKVEADLQGKKVKVKFWSQVGIIASALFTISIPGVIIGPLLFFIPLSGLFICLALFSLGIKLHEVIKKSRCERDIKSISLSFSRYGLGGNNLEEIIRNVERFENEYKKQIQEINKLSQDLGIVEELLKNQEESFDKYSRQISENLSTIEKIRKNSGKSSLEEYQKMVGEKNNLREEISTHKRFLQNFFPETPKDPVNQIAYWQDQLKEFEEYKDKVPEIRFSEKELHQLQFEISRYRDNIAEDEQKMEKFQRELEEIEKEVNNLLNLEKDYIYCRTSHDLESAKKELENFIKNHEEQRDNARKVFSIFEEIEKEEKARVAELFGSDSPVSSYFKEVTGGAYTEVTYDQNGSRLSVTRNNGELLGSEKLSSGAFDQLYLCIRLALGEKLLGGEKGFFIMDDPFIKSDKARLALQLNLLLKITEWGWQVLYFTAKEEVRTFLDRYIKNKHIKYIQLPGFTA